MSVTHEKVSSLFLENCTHLRGRETSDRCIAVWNQGVREDPIPLN